MADNQREHIIIRTSLIGIIGNIALAAVKAVIGLVSNSIAIVLDAVNNLSDALSSAITIIGAKLAGRTPNRAHPFGYGRVEYFSTILIGVIVLFAGITSLRESFGRIIAPETPSYETISLVVIAIAVVAKVALGRYFTLRGKAASSASLVASGTDALMDAAISASTLAAALAFIFFGISLEAWLGALISLVIIKAGFDILREAIGKILGERIDADVASSIKQTVCSVKGVRGAYDLILTDFGPERLWGSIHVSVDEHMTAEEIDSLTRRIETEVTKKHQVFLHTVGIYSANASDVADPEVKRVRQIVEEITSAHSHIKEVHGLFIDPSVKQVSFDVVIDFDAPDRQGEWQEIYSAAKRALPDYKVRVALDADISD
ncbi:cation diffusion facilitator family transporter [Cryptobacterium curtum DSM 15641]|uniref:Cation diffusion facilitator family transporter n=1 Tax=Cryptobacterium curtum (strain ATCC 700683 / DSM 15641 / CCUG 43107 / 12-3) TaxID=469378 RepID=C7MMR9_CRYCD|nr:cation diffusion facilitator family transporter [Cryptobacterium curtum]ACU94209.1 cation diffusion facilitator family transporter [Cryptobacterium curtum DSM 15641]